MVMVDSSGQIVLVNAQTEKLFGHRRDELLGQSVEVLIPARFRGAHPALRAGYLDDAEARPMGAGRDLFGLRKDGTEFPVEIGLNPIETEEGTFVLSAIIDITERKRLEAALQRANEELEAQVAERTEELRRANNELERSNLELKQFAYIASHDLQSPLRSISGFVQLLQSEYAGKLDAQADDWIDRTVRSIKHMQILIRDLLVYSRVDTQAQRFHQLPLRDVVDEARGQVADLIEETGAELTIGELPTVTGDRSQLIQMMQNLLNNALKYHGDAPPKIHIGAERGDGEWTIAVRDEGIGIEERYLERVFDIFHRLHDQSVYQGTGIGLAVCRRVVTSHGGRIWAQSRPGEGSTFLFTLPTRGEITDDH